MITGERQSRDAGCPTDLGLHRLMVGEGSDVELQAVRGHVGSCARCARRLAAFEAVTLPPLSELPAPAAGLNGGDTRPARRISRRISLAVAGALIAAAAAFVLLIRSGGDGTSTPGDVRTKGVLALGVVVKRPSGETARIASGDVLASGDVIRFELAHGGPGHAAVIGIDGRRAVSVYVPRPGQAGPFLTGAGTTVLPGAIRLDDATGAERLFALLCAEPISIDRIRDAARTRLAASGRSEQIESLGLPCAEASFVVMKAPAP
jgi:hypothetical protein